MNAAPPESTNRPTTLGMRLLVQLAWFIAFFCASMLFYSFTELAATWTGRDIDNELELAHLWPDQTELQKWYSKPLLPGDVSISHVEEAFFPLNLSNFNWDEASGGKYTRAWRMSAILRVLSSWASLSAALNLPYWVDSGTLLGLARSAGKSLIPWDADADVMMLQSAFQKLNRSMKETREEGILELSDGVILFTRQAPTLGSHSKVTLRDRLIPGRIIDTASGFYVDIFGDAFLRKDGAIQMFWPYLGPPHHSCNDTVEAGERLGADDCEGPCLGIEFCWIWPQEVVLPTVPCRLKGVRVPLECPHDKKLYLEEMFGNAWEQPAQIWDPDFQEFV